MEIVEAIKQRYDEEKKQELYFVRLLIAISLVSIGVGFAIGISIGITLTQVFP